LGLHELASVSEWATGGRSCGRPILMMGTVDGINLATLAEQEGPFSPATAFPLPRQTIHSFGGVMIVQ